MNYVITFSKKRFKKYIMTIGDRLKDLRKKKNIRLNEVERCTGICSSYISQIENNHIKNPSSKKMKLLANFYQIDLSLLLDEEHGKKDKNPLAHLSTGKKEAIIQAIKKAIF